MNGSFVYKWGVTIPLMLVSKFIGTRIVYYLGSIWPIDVWQVVVDVNRPFRMTQHTSIDHGRDWLFGS